MVVPTGLSATVLHRKYYMSKCSLKFSPQPRSFSQVIATWGHMMDTVIT